MTREEAIEVYNNIINQKIKEAFEVFAPELRESEDEKIKKTLIGYFTKKNEYRDVDELWEGLEIPNIIAWLEKQKEPKEELFVRINGLINEYIKAGADEAEQEHRLKCYHLFLDSLEDAEYFEQKDQKPLSTEETELNSITFLEQIGYTCISPRAEQKPAHTAKEMWKEMRLEVYAQASGNRHEPNYSDDSTKMFSLCDIDEIFEKIGNSAVGSHHAEWSKEDERIRQSIIKDIEFERNYTSATTGDVIGKYNEQINWLKSLRPQPKQEWSKEDENMMSDIIGVVVSESPLSLEEEAKHIDFLKSLRPQPHWKPSEEQMEALKEAMYQLDGSEYSDGIDSLFNDIKML